MKEDEQSVTSEMLTGVLLCEVGSVEKIDAMGSDLGLEQELVMYVWASLC